MTTCDAPPDQELLSTTSHQYVTAPGVTGTQNHYVTPPASTKPGGYSRTSNA